MNKTNLLIISALGLLSLSFIYSVFQLYSFKFPGKKNVELKINIPKKWKISKEKRGSDLYYSNLSQSNDNDILFSVLFYKLNDKEKELMVKSTGIENNPILPYTYFLTTSRTSKIESGKSSWDNDDFYYQDSNIEEFSGVKVHQKNMKAYCMYDDDLFVQVHLSKINYTPEDSVEMRNILNSIEK